MQGLKFLVFIAKLVYTSLNVLTFFEDANRCSESFRQRHKIIENYICCWCYMTGNYVYSEA